MNGAMSSLTGDCNNNETLTLYPVDDSLFISFKSKYSPVLHRIQNLKPLQPQDATLLPALISSSHPRSTESRVYFRPQRKSPHSQLTSLQFSPQPSSLFFPLRKERWNTLRRVSLDIRHIVLLPALLNFMKYHHY